MKNLLLRFFRMIYRFFSPLKPDYSPAFIEHCQRIGKYLGLSGNAHQRRVIRRWRTLFTLNLLLAFMSACGPYLRAQELPAKPIANNEFRVETAAFAASWTLDTISTAQAQGHCDAGRCYETGGLLNGYHSPASIMAAWAGVDLATVAISYEWKKHVHNRYLHPLWRVPLFVGAIGHTHAAIGNWEKFQ